MNKNEFYNLRNQIVLGSLFIKDYTNILYVESEKTCAFFDSAIEYINNDYKEQTGRDIDISKITKKQLYNYYLSLDYDALLQNDYIASKTICVYYAILILSINDYSVIVNDYFMDRFNEKTTKPKKYKLYYNASGDAYFNYNHKRQYINTFIRRDFR